MGKTEIDKEIWLLDNLRTGENKKARRIMYSKQKICLPQFFFQMKQVSEGTNHFSSVRNVLLVLPFTLNSFPIRREEIVYINIANPYKWYIINFNFCLMWQNSNINCLLCTAHYCVFVLNINVKSQSKAHLLTPDTQMKVFTAVKSLLVFRVMSLCRV
jgi:hypothetical protein